MTLMLDISNHFNIAIVAPSLDRTTRGINKKLIT